MFRRKVKAGVLLYAVFMAAVFSLLLQFYLNRQLAGQRLQLLNQEKTLAYAMAVLTKDRAAADEGRLEFDQGSTLYSRQGQTLEVSSRIKSGRSYRFTFASPEEESKEDKDKQQSDQKDPIPPASSESQKEGD